MPKKSDPNTKMERLINSFHKKYIKTDTCWLWTACVVNFGYGKLGLNTGENIYAHRLSYEIYKGKIPDGMCVCHTCDVPRCVNPDHLFLGTIQDNLIDMHKKGRGPVGQLHGGAKLKESDVIDILELLKTKSAYRVAKMYGMSNKAIQHIRSGKTWRMIPRC